jgi:hypothetical protein
MRFQFQRGQAALLLPDLPRQKPIADKICHARDSREAGKIDNEEKAGESENAQRIIRHGISAGRK